MEFSAPSLMSVINEQSLPNSSFKFFNVWAHHDAFLALVETRWSFQGQGTPMFRFIFCHLNSLLWIYWCGWFLLAYNTAQQCWRGLLVTYEGFLLYKGDRMLYTNEKVRISMRIIFESFFDVKCNRDLDLRLRISVKI